MTEPTEATPEVVAQDSPAIEEPSNQPEVKEAEPENNQEQGDSAPKQPEYVPDEKDVKIARQRAANEQMLAKIRELQEQLKTVQVVQKDDAPKAEDFDTEADYLIARGKHEAKKEFEAQQQAQAQQQVIAEQQKLIAEKERQFNEHEADLRKQKADYDTAAKDAEQAYVMMQHSSPKTFEIVRDYIFMAADNVPALMYYVGQNPDKLDALKGKSPPEIFKSLARMEFEISQAPKVEKSPLPQPISPISGGSKLSKSLEEMSGKELVDWVRKQKT